MSITVVGSPPRCRHKWRTAPACRRCGCQFTSDMAAYCYGEPHDFVDCTQCVRCGKVRDPAASRRARRNRSRGLAIQRKRNAGLGISNIAGNAPSHDGGTADELFVSESKSGVSFSERYWRWLSAIPRRSSQVPILIVTDTPGPGHRARSIVVVAYDDWRDLHGGTA